MDGVWWWCSTWCCLIFLLNGVWQGERKSAAKDALLSLGLLWLTLACSKVGLFLWWLCMLSFLSFCIWERTGELKREGGEGAEKDSMHTSRQRKTCHRRWQQPATHARKLAITSTRQQASMSDSRNIKNQVQKYWWILRQEPLDGDRHWATALDGYRHWAMALIGGSQTKCKGRVQKPLFNNHSITAKESWHYPMCSFNFCWGCVGDALARRMPYEVLVPRCKGILQCVNFHFIMALCAPSVSPCGSCGMVMDGHGHLHTVISKEFCWRAFARSMLMSHSAMGRHKLVCFCFPCALCFLSLCTLKS